MPTPQQPEIVPVEPPDGGPGPVPEENLPGHHPEHDQDKPEGPPPTPGVRPPKAKKAAKKRKAAAPKPKPKEAAVSPDPAAEGTRRFHFAFEPFMLPFAIPFGVTPMTAWVEVDGRELRVRFGPWSARTFRDNITGAAVTGPYSFPKVAGPAHLSFADGGATFATTTKRGVCLEFREPIPALVPLGLLRHSGLTVTVDDPEGLVTALGF